MAKTQIQPAAPRDDINAHARHDRCDRSPSLLRHTGQRASQRRLPMRERAMPTDPAATGKATPDQTMLEAMQPNGHRPGSQDRAQEQDRDEESGCIQRYVEVVCQHRHRRSKRSAVDTPNENRKASRKLQTAHAGAVIFRFTELRFGERSGRPSASIRWRRPHRVGTRRARPFAGHRAPP